MIRAALIWGALVVAVGVPLAAAATSPLLAWRDTVYIVAGFAGVAGLGLMLLQPLLMGGYLPGLRAPRGRRLHRWTGIALILAVAVHVAGLWITSPPDVIDALLFVSATPFAVWGVVAMWALFAAAALVLLRRRLRLSPRIWQRGHTFLVAIAVIGSIVHALLIQGTMEQWSKIALCVLVALATGATVIDLNRRRPRRAQN